MTEQKAIEQLERLSSMLGSIGETEDYTEVTINALEEIQKYRAIGTIDEFRAAVCKIRKIEEVVSEWDKVGFAYSSNCMCEIKMNVKGGGVNE